LAGSPAVSLAKASLSPLKMNRLPSVKVISAQEWSGELRSPWHVWVNFVHLGMFAGFARKMRAGWHLKIRCLNGWHQKKLMLKERMRLN